MHVCAYEIRRDESLSGKGKKIELKNQNKRAVGPAVAAVATPTPSEMSWLVPEVRVGDISLPMIRQCDSVDDPSAGEEELLGDCSFSISRDCADDGNNPMEPQEQQPHEDGHQQEPPRPQQLTWCVMSDDDDNNDDGQNENRGNLPREGALQLMMSSATPTTSGGLGSSLLAVPWQVPRRRHSWICRYLVYYIIASEALFSFLYCISQCEMGEEKVEENKVHRKRRRAAMLLSLIHI